MSDTERISLGEKYAEVYAIGYSIRDIAATFGKSYQHIHRCLLHVGADLRPRGGKPGNTNARKRV